MGNTNLDQLGLMPVLMLMLGEYVMVLLAVIADLVSGLRKARMRGEARRSKALRRTVDKLCRYYNALFALSVIDAMQMAAVAYLGVTRGNLHRHNRGEKHLRKGKREAASRSRRGCPHSAEAHRRRAENRVE